MAPRRTADAFCAQVRAAVERARARGRVAIVIAGNAGTHTPAGSKLVRALVEELAGELHLVYTPPYDPDSNRIEWLWRVTRRAVTHNHRHPDRAALEAAAGEHFRHLAAHPAEVLAHIGSPGGEVEMAHEPFALAA